jgi:signal transduction histidine kinase
MSTSIIKRVRPQRLRTRLAVLYALLFLAAGSSLLALTYALLASRLPTTSRQKPVPIPAICNQPVTNASKVGGSTKPSENSLPPVKLPECAAAFAAGANAGSQAQRDSTLSSLLLASVIGLGVIALASGALGWFISGRALRPIRAITEAAQRASELQLGERLALEGPQDELKELADTFDAMLERLDEAFASQERFVANAAHELLTPLTAMRTSIEVTLSKPSRTPEQLEAMAQKVRRSIERSESTITSLLTLAKSGRAPTTREPVDLAAAAEYALDAATPSIAKLGLTVNATLEPAPTTGAAALLERMIANLVDNAVRHNNQGGWITVHTGEHDDMALFEISNSGPYVPEQTIQSLFEPFGRADERLNPVDGVGLGLSIANAIGIAHSASVVARSRPGGGLHVSVTLPRAQAQTIPVGA